MSDPIFHETPFHVSPRPTANGAPSDLPQDGAPTFHERVDYVATHALLINDEQVRQIRMDKAVKYTLALIVPVCIFILGVLAVGPK